MSVQHLVWLPRVVVACVSVHPGGRSAAKSGAQLLFYPRYHLDNSSLLARYPLEQARVLLCVPPQPVRHHAPQRLRCWRNALQAAPSIVNSVKSGPLSSANRVVLSKASVVLAIG